MLQSNASAVPLMVEVNLLRLLQLALVFTALVGGSMYALHGTGLWVTSYATMTDSYEEQATHREHWNTISGYVMTALLAPVSWFLGTVLPVGFLSFAPNQHLQTKQTVYSVLLFTCLTVGAKSLVNMGFNAAFAKIKQSDLVPIISPSDLVINTDDLNLMLSSSTTMAAPISETTAGNYITNTVLRNVLAPIVLQADLTCNGTRELTGGYLDDTSQFATGLLQSYGFPLRSWQSNMLPINYGDYSEVIALNSSQGSDNWASYDMPMDVDTAANVFIHAMHMSQYFFRWFSEYPFNATAVVLNTTDPDYVDSDYDAPVHSVSAAKLLGLLPSSDGASDLEKAEWFLDAARDLFKKSLSSGVNISQDESTMEFSHVDISGNITFDSVTFEIPLRKNFYYRKLVLAGGTLQEDTTATVKYSSVDYADNTSDIYYDLDITADCGSMPGLCVMPHVQEYDVDGDKYQPDPQIKATAVCLNSNGSMDFQIDYDHYIVDTNSSETVADAYWACSKLSSTSMWIVSLGSRITGDEIYEGRATDSVVTSLDSNRATLVNPRKIYTLTVGRLDWDIVDLADEYWANCGHASCKGIEYFLDQTTNGKFDYNGTTTYNSTNETDQYIIVGESNIPSSSLRAFQYNETEETTAYYGYGAATRWVPLMTLVTPMADEYYTLKGNVIFPYNFDSMNWTSGNRSGTSCSDATEDYLNHVVNNHYYMEHGLQPAYTAGMYFLLQNGVVRNVTNVNDTASTLVFDYNVKIMGIYMSTPKTSMAFTICGISILLLGTIVVLVWSWWIKRGVQSRSRDVTVEMVADMMLNDKKYPHSMFHQSIESPFFIDGARVPLSQLRIERIVLHHEEKEISFTLPLDNEKLTEGERSLLKSERTPSDVFYAMEDGKQPSA